jgi:hypothetical protein
VSSAAALALLLALSGCGGSNPGGPTGGASGTSGGSGSPGGSSAGSGSTLSPGMMTATVDGVPFSGTITVAAIAAGNSLVVSGTSGLGTNSMLTIAVSAPAQIGTYAVGPIGQLVGTLTAHTAVSATDGWLAAGPSGSGSLTISTLTSTGATGTFSFVLTPNVATGSNRIVTNGAFNARLPTP